MDVIATAAAHDEYGGLVILALGAAYYGAVVLKDYLGDVRYYRARRVVRDREGVK